MLYEVILIPIFKNIFFIISDRCKCYKQKYTQLKIKNCLSYRKHEDIDFPPSPSV